MNDCFCTEYETYFLRHSIQSSVLTEIGLVPCNDSNETNVKDFAEKDINQISDNISVTELYFEKKFYKYLDEHHEEIMKEIGSYDASYIKLLLLLLDGDIESNPGPAQSNSTTRGKGRPKKSKGFRVGKCKKNVSDVQSIDLNVNSNMINSEMPLGLLNLPGENVCFFNAVTQVLYSITAFRDYVLKYPLLCDNPPVQSMKNLFREMQTGNTAVRTRDYLYNHNIDDIDIKKDKRDANIFGLQGYEIGKQYDAHECLLKILDKIYPTISTECVFKTDLFQSLICETPNCTYKSEGNDTIKRFDLPVELQETRTTQTVSSLLNQYKHIHGTFASDYKCDGCKKGK